MASCLQASSIKPLTQYGFMFAGMSFQLTNLHIWNSLLYADTYSEVDFHGCLIDIFPKFTSRKKSYHDLIALAVNPQKVSKSNMADILAKDQSGAIICEFRTKNKELLHMGFAHLNMAKTTDHKGKCSYQHIFKFVFHIQTEIFYRTVIYCSYKCT